MPKVTLSDSELRTLAAFAHLAGKGAPSLQEIGQAQGVSYTVASRNMAALIDKGVVDRDPGRARSYRLTTLGRRLAPKTGPGRATGRRAATKRPRR